MSHKFPSSVFFFAQDLVSHAATSDFDQSLQIVDACDRLRLCEWQFSSYLASELCSQRLAKVKLIIRNIVRFRVVLTCVLCHKCVNVRLLGMHVQMKRLYAFLACIFDENTIRILRVLE